jgi:hypothetical protein
MSPKPKNHGRTSLKLPSVVILLLLIIIVPTAVRFFSAQRLASPKVSAGFSPKLSRTQCD